MSIAGTGTNDLVAVLQEQRNEIMIAFNLIGS
jgi:hypothetical protein